MLPSNAQKKNLIQAMKKLTYQISNNSQRQKQIFDSLASNDLIKIVQNLYDDNQYLRRISALLLCELFYSNKELKNAMVEKLCMPISHGRICLNRIPDSNQKTPLDIRKCLELMKSPLRKGEDEMFCWAINLDKKYLDLQFYQFKKYSSFTFLDPQRVIFGFTVIDPAHEHNVPLSPATQSLQFTAKSDLKQKRQYQQEKIQNEHPPKRYSISKKIQAPIRPVTSMSSRDKEIYLSSSKQKNYNFMKQSQDISSINPINSSIQPQKTKLGTSIQSISQYARNSYGRPSQRLKQKQRERERFSLSFTNDLTFDSTHLNSERNQSRKSYQIQSSIGKIRGNSKTPQNHHENFYKRVQQILRK